MSRQKLFETIMRVTGFTPLESDMDEIQTAVESELSERLEIQENYNDMLIRELTELKEKHKEDVETAFSEGLFLPHDSDLTAEQYYNETHKTK